MPKTVDTLRTGNEKLYQALMIIAGILLWIAIIAAVKNVISSDDQKIRQLGIVYFSYALAFAAFIYFSGLAYRASAFGNMILLGPTQFPDLYEMVVAGSRDIGLRDVPRTFLYNSNGLINAFARRLLGGNYVFLTSALVEATTDAQIRFVIGHELGHHAAGHLNPWMNTLKLPAHAVPFLGKAYSRSREYSCDRIGAYLSQDVAASRSSLQMLGCGCRRLNDYMSCEAFVQQEAMVPPLFGFLTEIFRTHPRLTRRVAAIRQTVENSTRR